MPSLEKGKTRRRVSKKRGLKGHQSKTFELGAEYKRFLDNLEFPEGRKRKGAVAYQLTATHARKQRKELGYRKRGFGWGTAVTGITKESFRRKFPS